MLLFIRSPLARRLLLWANLLILVCAVSVVGAVSAELAVHQPALPRHLHQNRIGVTRPQERRDPGVGRHVVAVQRGRELGLDDGGHI